MIPNKKCVASNDISCTIGTSVDESMAIFGHLFSITYDIKPIEKIH